MSSFLVACVVVACLVSDLGAVPKNSGPPTTPAQDLCQLSGYDIARLKSRDYWVANITGQPSACFDPGNCTYYFAFCQALQLPATFSATNCNQSAVCQIGHANTTQTSYSLGMYTDDTRFYANGDRTGFSMHVFYGSNTTLCTTGITATVYFQCNESAVWTTQNVTDFITVVNRSGPIVGCQFDINLQYSGACNHPNVSPTSSSVKPTPTSSKGHMNHTTQHLPHLNTSSHSMNLSTHSMHPTASHSTGNHSSSKHPSSTIHPGTISHNVLSTSPTKASLSTSAYPLNSPTKLMPSATPLPPHHTTPQPHSHTKPATKPTENPLSHKVVGLTAGVVIFALIAIGLVAALVGVVFYFFNRGGNKYNKISNAD